MDINYINRQESHKDMTLNSQSDSQTILRKFLAQIDAWLKPGNSDRERMVKNRLLLLHQILTDQEVAVDARALQKSSCGEMFRKFKGFFLDLEKYKPTHTS